MTSTHWIIEGEADSPSREELLQLYQLYQTRQIADLDMLHKYANYYVGALLAMQAALILGVTRGYATPVAGVLVALPLLSFMLCLQGKLMAFRFYRRYTEGRVRLAKIEHLLGLCGPVTAHHPPDGLLWPEDDSFLLGRYRREADMETHSSDFVVRRSKIKLFKGYGAGYIIQTTFTVFAILFALMIVALPLGLQCVTTSGDYTLMNSVVAFIAINAGGLFLLWYILTARQMITESGMEKENK